MSPEPSSSPQEKDILSQLARQLTPQKTVIVSELHRALQVMELSNCLLISPRRLEEMAQEEAEALLQFLETGAVEETRARGARRASEGLGSLSALAMTETTRQVCWIANPSRETLRVALEACGRYVSAFLEGYMSGREEEILTEQERMRQAFQRALERQSHS